MRRILHSGLSEAIAKVSLTSPTIPNIFDRYTKE